MWSYLDFLYYTTTGFFTNRVKHDIYMTVLEQFEKKYEQIRINKYINK